MKKGAVKELEIKEIAIIIILFLVVTITLIILTNLDKQIITGLITGVDNIVDQNDSSVDSNSGNNFTFSTINFTANLISPENPSYKNVNNISFNCSVQSDLKKQITNITFKLFNESSLIYSETKELTGILNSTIFNYNFSEENIYYWSCEAYNNETGLATSTNFTIIYDIISPIINLIEPENGKSYTTTNDQEIEFTFTINDKSDINNCSLISNNEIKLTNNSVDKNLTQNFKVSFSPGNYEWNINCIDKTNNIANSERRSLSISSIEISREDSSEESEEESESREKVSASSEGGEGGEEGRSVEVGKIEKTEKTYFVSNEQFSVGYTKELNKKDEIKFVFEDEKIFKHSLTINEITNDFVEITVQSEPINLKLTIGEEKKLNLTNPANYDFYVKLNSINDNKASITIKLINEKINEPQGITGFSVDEDKIEGNETGISKIIGFVTKPIKSIGSGKGSLLIYLIIAIIIIFIMVFFFRKKYKEKMKELK